MDQKEIDARTQAAVSLGALESGLSFEQLSTYSAIMVDETNAMVQRVCLRLEEAGFTTDDIIKVLMAAGDNTVATAQSLESLVDDIKTEGVE